MNYKQYLLEAKGNEDFKVRFGNLVRNTSGRITFGFREAAMMDEYLAEGNIAAAAHLGFVMLKTVFNPTVKERRRIPLHRYINKREDYRETVEEYGVYDYDSDELVPIIHGGDVGRINGILHHKRGYEAHVPAPNPEKKEVSTIGFMVHSTFSGRAKAYARLAAEQHCSTPAVLMAFVPKRYTYNNQGDEYTLHTWNYKHMQDVKVITIFDDEYYYIEEFYKENYLSTTK